MHDFEVITKPLGKPIIIYFYMLVNHPSAMSFDHKVDNTSIITKWIVKTVQLHHSFYTIWTYSHLDFRSKWIACFKWDAYRSTKTIFFYDSIVLSFLLSLSIARNEWRFAIMYEIRNASLKILGCLNILRSRNT